LAIRLLTATRGHGDSSEKASRGHPVKWAEGANPGVGDICRWWFGGGRGKKKTQEYRGSLKKARG